MVAIKDLTLPDDTRNISAFIYVYLTGSYVLTCGHVRFIRRLCTMYTIFNMRRRRVKVNSGKGLDSLITVTCCYNSCGTKNSSDFRANRLWQKYQYIWTIYRQQYNLVTTKPVDKKLLNYKFISRSSLSIILNTYSTVILGI